MKSWPIIRLLSIKYYIEVKFGGGSWMETWIQGENNDMKLTFKKGFFRLFKNAWFSIKLLWTGYAYFKIAIFIGMVIESHVVIKYNKGRCHIHFAQLSPFYETTLMSWQDIGTIHQSHSVPLFCLYSYLRVGIYGYVHLSTAPSWHPLHPGLPNPGNP